MELSPLWSHKSVNNIAFPTDPEGSVEKLLSKRSWTSVSIEVLGHPLYISQTTYQSFTCQSVFWFLWNTSSYFSSTGMHLRTFGSTMVMGSMVIIQSYPESIYPFICLKLLNISKKLLPPICAKQLQPHVATLLLLNASAACLLSPRCKASQAKRHRTLPIFYRCYWRKSNIEGLLATSHCPGSDWKNNPRSCFEGMMAMSLCPGSDWNSHQMSCFEGLLAMSRCPGSD